MGSARSAIRIRLSGCPFQSCVGRHLAIRESSHEPVCVPSRSHRTAPVISSCDQSFIHSTKCAIFDTVLQDKFSRHQNTVLRISYATELCNRKAQFDQGARFFANILIFARLDQRSTSRNQSFNPYRLHCPEVIFPLLSKTFKAVTAFVSP